MSQATYVFGNYVDEALTMDRGGETDYYHQNTLWSPYALTDSNGNGVEGYQYDAYGYQTPVRSAFEFQSTSLHLDLSWQFARGGRPLDRTAAF